MMNNTAKLHSQQTSLIRQLKRSLLLVASLIASIFIFGIPFSAIASPAQHNLDAQQGALQEDLNTLLISMVNQETGLRGYITTDNSAFLQPFTDGRPQFLLAVQRLAGQAHGSDFKETISALARVEEEANAWYSTYAEVQLRNMQSGQLATARAISTNTFGKALFDQFRAAVAHLQDAIRQDINTVQSRIKLLSLITFVGIVLLAAIAIIVLWRTLFRFIKALNRQLGILMSTASQLGAKDLASRVPELSYVELNRLGQTFNTMAQRLEEADRARSQFLSTMSHELRTPLASIVGFGEMLLEDAIAGGWDPLQRSNLESILHNGEHLLDLINDVLDLSKIEAGRMVVDYSQVDVGELLSSVTEEIGSLARTRHLFLRTQVQEDIACLETNQMKLRQILLNLLSNALKFTEQGGVTLSARRLLLSDQQTEGIAFTVQDTGIGIPKDIQARIFEAFYQVDMSYTRKVGGTGLGLSIVSQLTALLGGTISVESAPGQGSTFTVTLPVKAAHPLIEKDLPRLHPGLQQDVLTNPLSAAKPTPLSEMLEISGQPETAAEQHDLILVVDDNPEALVFVKAALQGMPYNVIGVQDSLAVLGLAQELHPSAITLDVMMPRLNGWQLLHRLKDNPATASIPVVMLTVLSEQTTGYVLGADEYLIKPFKKETLQHTLQHVIEMSKQETQQVGSRG